MSGDAGGFTLIEVLISMVITLIVMAAVFALLSGGQRSFRREPEVADLQQTARAALDMVSRDALQAGAGLPPEFPAFTTGAIDPMVGDGGANPDSIEIVGAVGGAGEKSVESAAVLSGSFGGDPSTSTFTLDQDWSNFKVGELVLLWDNAPLNGYWIMGYVTAVQPGPPPVITIAAAPTDTKFGGPLPTNYQGRSTTVPAAWNPTLVTPVTVVRYFTQPDPTMGPGTGPPPNALMRTVNFGVPSPVAYLEDFQIVYLVGGTLPANEQDNPPDPQPNVTVGIDGTTIVNGVRIQVSARSLSENLEGSTTGNGNFIRKSFSSSVNPRNITAGLAARAFGGP
jgi:prepilin-type N-terminal cleavage/methylation domain-containing protein